MDGFAGADFSASDMPMVMGAVAASLIGPVSFPFLLCARECSQVDSFLSELADGAHAASAEGREEAVDSFLSEVMEESEAQAREDEDTTLAVLERIQAHMAERCDCLATMRAELIGHFQPCMTDIYLHIDARMADYIRTQP